MIVRIEKHIPLAPLTSFKIGGTADYFCRVKNEEELRAALAFARERALPLLILGGGTNVLVSDGGFRGLVVKMEMRGIMGEGILLVALAGEEWDALVAYAVEGGLWGIENLSGIPGTVGGAPVQNIGAYGAELQEVVEWVDTIDTRTGTARRFSNAECAFGYRDSIFKKPEGKQYLITRVALRLPQDGAPNLLYKDLAEYFKISHHPASPTRHPSSSKEGRGMPTLSEVRRAVLDIRSRKFPPLTRYGTAGSFFKNPIIPRAHYEKLKEKYPGLPMFFVLKIHPQSPSFIKGGGGGRILGVESEKEFVKIPLAWILDKVCNLNGFAQGNAALWENQPLVLVNRGGACAAEVRALADEVAEKVRAATDLELEWEVQRV